MAAEIPTLNANSQVDNYIETAPTWQQYDLETVPVKIFGHIFEAAVDVYWNFFLADKNGFPARIDPMRNRPGSVDLPPQYVIDYFGDFRAAKSFFRADGGGWGFQKIHRDAEELNSNHLEAETRPLPKAKEWNAVAARLRDNLTAAINAGDQKKIAFAEKKIEWLESRREFWSMDDSTYPAKPAVEARDGKLPAKGDHVYTPFLTMVDKIHNEFRNIPIRFFKKIDWPQNVAALIKEWDQLLEECEGHYRPTQLNSKDIERDEAYNIRRAEFNQRAVTIAEKLKTALAELKAANVVVGSTILTIDNTPMQVEHEPKNKDGVPITVSPLLCAFTCSRSGIMQTDQTYVPEMAKRFLLESTGSESRIVENCLQIVKERMGKDGQSVSMGEVMRYNGRPAFDKDRAAKFIKEAVRPLQMLHLTADIANRFGFPEGQQAVAKILALVGADTEVGLPQAPVEISLVLFSCAKAIEAAPRSAGIRKEAGYYLRAIANDVYAAGDMAKAGEVLAQQTASLAAACREMVKLGNQTGILALHNLSQRFELGIDAAQQRAVG